MKAKAVGAAGLPWALGWLSELLWQVCFAQLWFVPCVGFLAAGPTAHCC